MQLAISNLANVTENGPHFGTSQAQSLEELVDEINKNEVDVILVENHYLFSKDETLANLLSLFPKLLVIFVDENSNWIRIFRREDILMKSSTDLLNLIQSA